MTNLEVARCILTNAKAYAKAGDMDTVLHNLEYIGSLLEKPEEQNPDHTWKDFQ